MKKQFFSLVMMLALVIVTGTAFGQTKATPYVGQTYTYTISGIDALVANRNVTIYLTATGNTTKLDVEAAGTTFTVANKTNLVGVAKNGAHDAWVATFEDNAATTFSFDVTWTDCTAATARRLWVEIALAGGCSNMIYMDITPTANNIQYAISVPVSYCPATTTPVAENTDAVNATTVLIYTVTRTNGNANDDWSFDFAVDPTTYDGVNVVVSAQAGGVYNAGNVYVDCTANDNSVEVTVTVTNSPGTAADDFEGAISNTTQYVGQTTEVNNTADTGGDNSDSTNLNYIPSIGSFN